MHVTKDGTVFTNVEWEEGGGNVGEYKNGELVRYAMHTHGWGANGGLCVAANSNYVFAALVMGNEGGNLKDEATWPPKGFKWYGVSRRMRADVSRAAPFPSGKGGKGDTLKQSFLVVAELPEKEGLPLAGMAATETELYVSDPNTSEIKVFNCESMELSRKWKVERAGALAMDRWGNLAMLESAGSAGKPRVLYFGRGQKAWMEANLPEGAVPSAICFRDNRLLVADIGPEQQILVYAPVPDSRAMQLESRFGERGGLAAAKGVFGDRRFNDVRGIGCDEAGHLYVAHNGQTGGGGTVLECYTFKEATLKWRLFGLTFVDLADADPISDTDVFTKEEHFTVDYSKPTGKEWSYKGYTVDRWSYPEDPRLHIWSAGTWVRRIGGARILFVYDMNGNELQVYRFAKDRGEIAIPSSLFAKRHISFPKSTGWPPNQPARGEWIWRDADGNGAFGPNEFQQPTAQADAPASQGWWVDDHGNVWLATETKGIRLFPSAGLDAKGNPVWNYGEMQTFPHPAEVKQVKRLRYVPATDTLFLAGTTDDHRNQHWKPSGPVIARYDGWLKGSRTLRWKAVLPYAAGSQGHSSCEPMGFDVAGDYVLVPYTGASREHGVKHGRVEVFSAADARNIGHLEPSAEIGEIGLQDIRECLNAHRRADGEYIVFLEDDYKSKVVMYRFE